METGSIFLILALVLCVAAILSWPFLHGAKEESSAAVQTDADELSEDHQRSTLLAERDRLLNALQELDFDAALGKVPAEDYPVQREALLMAGAGVLRQLDEMAGKQASGDEVQRMQEAADARRADAPTQEEMQATSEEQPPPGVLAAEVASAAPSVNDDMELENMIAQHRRQRKENSAGFCPHCGKPVQKSDRFCPRCGGNL
jgi:hypothetical protein